MTTDPDILRLSPSALGPISFLSKLAPLPLVDPTEAARFLAVERHTLACYRSLSDGPPYYKFGRWIRYAEQDLQDWRHGTKTGAPHPLGQSHAADAQLVDATTAARYLTVTLPCLRNYRIEGVGPRFCRFGRRLHYPVTELRAWAEAQRHPASRARVDRAACGGRLSSA